MKNSEQARKNVVLLPFFNGLSEKELQIIFKTLFNIKSDTLNNN